MNENKQTSTGSNKLSLGLKVLGLLLIIAAFAYLLYQNKTKSDSIKIQKKEIVLKDSLINDYKLKEQKIDLLSDVVKSYLEERMAHNAEALNEYYADTLEHYYKYLSNSSKEKVMAAEKKYWTSFKVDSFLVKSEPKITIDSNQIQAIVKGLQCVKPDDCLEEIMVLKFNPSFKIISVKAYFQK